MGQISVANEKLRLSKAWCKPNGRLRVFVAIEDHSGAMARTGAVRKLWHVLWGPENHKVRLGEIKHGGERCTGDVMEDKGLQISTVRAEATRKRVSNSQEKQCQPRDLGLAMARRKACVGRQGSKSRVVT